MRFTCIKPLCVSLFVRSDVASSGAMSRSVIVAFHCHTVKPVLSTHTKEEQRLVFKTDYCLIQSQSIAECSKRAFCNTSTCIKQPSAFKTFVVSIINDRLRQV